MVRTTSESLATSAAELATAAPRRPASSSASGLTSYASTENPALRRLVTMGVPMVPTPMNPTRFMVCPPVKDRH
jgi:hypothetical protein